MFAVEHKYTLQRVTVLMIALNKKKKVSTIVKKNIWEDEEIVIVCFPHQFK